MPRTRTTPTVTGLYALGLKRGLVGPNKETTWIALVAAWDGASEEERAEAIAAEALKRKRS
jgi:hypothetical protein